MILKLYILTFISVMLAFCYQIMKNNKNYSVKKFSFVPYILLVFLLVMCSSLRVTERFGTDEYRYRLYVELSEGLNLWEYILEDPTEALFQFLKWFCGNIFHSSQSFIVISSILTQIPILEFLRQKSFNFTLAVFVYLCSGTFFMSFIPINQYIAIGLITYSLLWIKENKFGPYYLTVLVASLFHSSAIVLLPFPLLSYIRLSFPKIVIIIILALIIGINYSLFFYFVSSTQYAIYENEEYFSYGMNLFRIFFWILQYLLILYFILKKYNEKDISTNLIIWGMISSMFFYIASSQYVMFNRFEMFFGIIGIAGVSAVTSIFKGRMRILTTLIFIIIYIYYGYYAAINAAPYYSIFSNVNLWII